jgi:hypothetical protein
VINDTTIVRALAETIVEQRFSGSGAAANVGQFLLDVRNQMPDFLRFPFFMLTLVFEAWPLASTMRPFHRLPYERRVAQIEAWRHSRIEARRRLIEFYETLALFGLYSDLYQEDYEHAEPRAEP